MLARMQRSTSVTLGIVCFVAFALIGNYLVNPFHAPSQDWVARIVGFRIFRCTANSMEPAVKKGSYIVVNAAALRARDPRAGEIVAFQYPPDPKIEYLKRVVAIGGSVVELRAGALYVDGKLVDEPYVDAESRLVDVDGEFPAYKVPPGTFFVLGDNRGNSSDSRHWGVVPRELIVGTYVSLSGG